MTPKRLKELQDAIAERRKRRDKAIGAKEQILNDLKEKYGVETIKDAKRLHEKKEAKVTELEKELDKLEKDFEKKWGDKI